MENSRQKKQRRAWVQRMLDKDPDYFKKLGKKGGSYQSPSKGFGTMSLINPEKHRQASAKGGTRTARRKIDTSDK